MRQTAFIIAAVLSIALIPAVAQSGEGLLPVTSARATADSRVEALEANHRAVYFCPPDDITKWSVFWLPKHLHFSALVGGCKDGLLVLGSVDAEETGDPNQPINQLQLLTFDGNLKTIAPGGLAAHCEFFDDKIGCQVIKKNLLVTVDGGHKWRKMPIDLAPTADSGVNEDIVTDLEWLSSSELIVGKYGGEVTLLKIDEKGGKVRWTVNMASKPSSFSAEGDKAIWLWTSASDIVLLSRKDGHEITRVKTGIADKDGLWLAADAKRVYVWGDQYPKGKTPEQFTGAATQEPEAILSVWNWDGSVLTPQQTFATDSIASVVPLNKRTIVFYRDGKIRALDGMKLVPQQVGISEVGHFPGQPDIDGVYMVAPATQPYHSDVQKINPADFLPTQEEQAESGTALRSVSASAVVEILQELSGREDLTPRQRCLLVIEKCKAIVATRPSH